MKARIKKALQKRALKKVHWYGLVIGTIALVLTMAYVFIPRPGLDDGYLRGETRKISQDNPLRLTFNQSMHRASVERHFSILPNLPGEFNWIDSQTLEYVFDNSLNINDEYTVALDKEAKSIFGKTIGSDLRLNYVVTGPPYVKFIYPIPLEPETAEIIAQDEVGDSTALEEGIDELIDSDPIEDALIQNRFSYPTIKSDQIITVMFDRPMVSFDSFSETGDFSHLLQVNPPVKGAYQWLNASVLQFIPEKWSMGTVYELNMPAGIESLDGGVTHESYMWKLRTEPLSIVRHSPELNDFLFPINGLIRLEFNQPVDLNDVRPGKNILLYPSNDLDANQALREDGFFNTEVVYGQDDQGLEDKSVLLFKPEFDYQYGQNYELIVKSGLKPLALDDYRHLSLEEDYHLYFKTVNKPGILDYKIADLADENGLSTIQILFKSPVKLDTIQDRIQMTPSVPFPDIDLSQKKFEENDEFYWQADLHYQLDPSTNYRFQFKSPFKDALGNLSKDSINQSFKTSALDPLLELNDTNPLFLIEGTDPIYSLSALNTNRIDLRVCEVSESKFISVDQNYAWDTFRCPNGTGVTIRPELTLNKKEEIELDLAKLYRKDYESGIYFMEISSPDYVDNDGEVIRLYQPFFLTNTHLTLKKSDQDLLVWATDLKTGEPISRLDIEIISPNGEELQRGVTDGDGIYKITKAFESPLYIKGKKTIQGETRWSLVSELWNEKFIVDDYYRRGDWVHMAEPRIYLNIDRPSYSTGDQVFIKGYYRIDRDALLEFPTDTKIKLIIADNESQIINQQNLSILPDGSFTGAFELSDDFKPGYYDIYAELISGSYAGQRFYRHFNVIEPSQKVLLLDSVPKDSGKDYLKPKIENLLEISTKNRIIDAAQNIEAVISSKATQFNEDQKINVSLYYEANEESRKLIEKKTFTPSNEFVEVSFPYSAKMMAGRYIMSASLSENDKVELSYYVVDQSNTSVSSESIQLIPDRTEYDTGGKARILIITPGELSSDHPKKMLLTYERGDIQHYEIIDITSSYQVVQTSITTEMSPNIYVSALLIEVPGDKLESYLNVRNLQKEQVQQDQLVAQISTLKDEIQELKTNQGVDKLEIATKESEVDLLTKNLADIQNDTNPSSGEFIPYESILPKFKNGFASLIVNEPEHDIDVNLQINEKFTDTGKIIEVEIRTTDYQNRPLSSTLSMVISNKVNIESLKIGDYFYGERALQTNTAGGLFSGGAISRDIELNDLKYRNNEVQEDSFVYYFNPLIQTDQGGYAKVNFEVPYSVSEFNLNAIVSSDQDKFGSINQWMKLADSLSIDIDLPFSAVSGDTFNVMTTFYNNSDQDLDLPIEVISDDFSLQGQVQKSVNLPAGQSKNVYWNLHTHSLPAQKNASIQFKYGDKSTIKTILLKPLGFSDQIYGQGVTSDLYQDEFSYDSAQGSEADFLKLRTGSSAFVHFIDELEQLHFSSLGSNGDILNRLLPSLIMHNRLSVEDMNDIDSMLYFKPLEIQALIQKIELSQLANGGYVQRPGYQREDIALTALMIYDQYLASQLNLEVSQNRYQYAIRYLWNRLNESQSEIDLTDFSFALWMLSEVGQYDTTMTLSLFENRSELTIQAKAYLLMNLIHLYEAGQQSVQPFIDKLKSEILNDQINDADRSYFQVSDDSERLTSAMVMMALNRDDKNNSALENLFSTVIKEDSKHFATLNELAFIAQSGLEYLLAHKDRGVSFGYEISLNDQVLSESTFAESDFWKADEIIIAGHDLKTVKPNVFSFNPDTQGELYYDYELSYFNPTAQQSSAENGIYINQQYYSLNDNPLTNIFRKDELYRNQLTFIVPESARDMKVRIPLPAGFVWPKSVDLSNGVIRYSDPDSHFNYIELYPDYLMLHAEYLEPGVYNYSYLIQAHFAGKYTLLPATVHLLNDSQKYGWTAAQKIEVR